MDIVEATKLVKSGFLVRRASWPSSKYMGMDSAGLYIAMKYANGTFQHHFSVTVDEITASDWLPMAVRNTVTQRKLKLKAK